MRKEWIHIKRDPRFLVIIFFAPIMLLALFGYALRLQPEHIPMTVCDEDKSYFSMMVKDRLIDENAFRLEEVSTPGEIERSLRTGSANVGLYIPREFLAAIADGRQGDLMLYVDGTMPAIGIASQLGATALTSDEFVQSFVLEDPEAPPGKVLAPRPFKLHKRILFNPDLKDQNFFIPGIIGILIMWITLVLTSVALVREREYRTFEQLIVTPVRPLPLVLGKIAPYAIIAFMDFFVITLMGHLVFGVPVAGNPLLLVLLAFLYIVGFLSLGMCISTIARTQTQAIFFSVFVIIPSFLLSGFVFPIEAMPPVLQPVPSVIPLTYFLHIARGVMLKGVGMEVLFKDFLILSLFSVVFIAASALRFRKTLE